MRVGWIGVYLLLLELEKAVNKQELEIGDWRLEERYLPDKYGRVGVGIMTCP